MVLLRKLWKVNVDYKSPVLGFGIPSDSHPLPTPRGNCLSRANNDCYKNLFDFIRMNYQLTYADWCFRQRVDVF